MCLIPCIWVRKLSLLAHLNHASFSVYRKVMCVDVIKFQTVWSNLRQFIYPWFSEHVHQTSVIQKQIVPQTRWMGKQRGEKSDQSENQSCDALFWGCSQYMDSSQGWGWA